MNNDTNGTARTVVLVIVDDTTAGTMTADQLARAGYVSARTDTPPGLNVPDLEAFRPPKKRGRYWENDLTRQFGRKRRQ